MMPVQEDQVMNILLQSLRSRKFCKSPMEWTDDTAEAMDFMNSDQAIDFAQKHQLPEVQLVAQFRDNHYVQFPFRLNTQPQL
jgi:hypothetical protein